MMMRQAGRRNSLGAGAMVFVAAVLIALAACAQSNSALELPEQIHQSQDGGVSIENLLPPNASRDTDVIFDPISTLVDRQPVIIFQQETGRDLCGPGLSDWELQHASDNCRGIGAETATFPKSQTDVPIATEPLRSSGVDKVFSALGLSDKIPVTVILKKNRDGEEIFIPPIIQANGQVTNNYFSTKVSLMQKKKKCSNPEIRVSMFRKR